MNRENIITRLDLIQYVRSHGSHFFDPDTMRYFSSRLLGPIHQKGELVFFVTSERFIPMCGPADPRKYTIRCLDLRSEHVTITEIGTFQQYKTAREAKRALAKYLKDLSDQ